MKYLLKVEVFCVKNKKLLKKFWIDNPADVGEKLTVYLEHEQIPASDIYFTILGKIFEN